MKKRLRKKWYHTKYNGHNDKYINYIHNKFKCYREAEFKGMIGYLNPLFKQLDDK